MKILLYGINYAPEPTGIAKYTNEMAQWLAQHGHEVRVITAPPYYPAWKVGNGFKAWAYSRRTEANGVRVCRCPLWVPKAPSGLKRVLHLTSFAITSLPIALAQTFWRPDVVWVVAPAFACVPGALLTAKLSGAKSWLHVQDFEVDAAFDLGLLKGRLLRTLVQWNERFLMRRFDVVSSISHRMVDRLVQNKGITADRALYFPNWVDVSAISPLKGHSPYRTELGLAPGTVVALFSGTLAAKQGLHLLPDVARQLAHTHPHVHMLICGDGVMKPHLQAATAHLGNVTMMPLQPKERLADLLGTADIHLLPQDPNVADLVMPSKLSGMLSSGRPVVSTTLRETEVGQVVHTAGLVVPPGDVSAFAQAIGQLADDPDMRTQLGHAGRRYAEEHLSLDGALHKFVDAVHCTLHDEKPEAELALLEDAAPPK